MDVDAGLSVPLWILLFGAFFLILLSMIFSATESAFLSINKLRVRLLKNQKKRGAIRVWWLLNNKERLINTLLVANNIVNIALSSILAYIAVSLFGNAGVGIATFVATMLLLIFGEISPKTVATHHPEAIAFFFAPFISVTEVIFSPLVFLFTGISRAVLKIAGIDTKKRTVSFTEEEIKTFIDVGGETGVIQANEKNMMHRVFSFADLEAKDIMIPRKDIKAISVKAHYTDVIQLAQRFRVSRFPVYRRDIDDIVGILYVKDLLFFSRDPSGFTVEKCMRQPLFILATKKMSGIQEMLRQNHQGMAIVIDEYSGTYGVLTSEDIAREIFGPIEDEYQLYSERTEAKILDAKLQEVSGLMRLTELNEKLGIHVTSKTCETLGGWLCETLGRIPACGDMVHAEGVTFTVTGMQDKRVSVVLIKQDEGDI